MANWTTASPTLDQAFSDAQTYGSLQLAMYFKNAATTAAATNVNGGISIQRCSLGGNSGLAYTVPSVTAPTTGFCFTGLEATASVVGGLLVGLEYTLGTLTVSGNSYSDGVAMPTKTVRGSSIQTSSLITMAYVSASMTATTPVLTFNYTNQAGTTGRSSSITLPTNATVNSCYLVNNNLQSGDTGIQDLSASGPNGLSISTGSAGTVKLIGILPIGFIHTGGANSANPIDVLDSPSTVYKAEAGETIGFYYFNNALAMDGIVCLNGTPEQ